MLAPFLVGEREEAEGESERRDGHRHSHHLLLAGRACTPMASSVSGPWARAGPGDDVRAPRRMPDAREGHAAGLPGQRGGGCRRQERRRRDPGRRPAGMGGVASEPGRGCGRRGEREGRARGVAWKPQLQVRCRVRRGSSCGDGGHRLAAVQRVRQRLRVGQAGGRPERRREQAGRDGHGLRGRRRGREHGAGGLRRP
ncbi:hypothetical protein VPH35_033901 [Triticum aestivum]